MQCCSLSLLAGLGTHATAKVLDAHPGGAGRRYQVLLYLVVVGGLLPQGGRPFALVADWMHCTSAMYLTNVQRLALHLEGSPDAPQAVVQAAVTAAGYKGYVAPDYAAPPAPPKGGAGGPGAGGSGTP